MIILKIEIINLVYLSCMRMINVDDNHTYLQKRFLLRINNNNCYYSTWIHICVLAKLSKRSVMIFSPPPFFFIPIFFGVLRFNRAQLENP